MLKRGITKEMIEKFEIGYASPAWDAATKILQKEVYRCLVWNKLVFIRSEKDGSHYDRFRGRVMFPIYTLQGKVIAFSGRALGDDTPKYLIAQKHQFFTKVNCCITSIKQGRLLENVGKWSF